MPYSLFIDIRKCPLGNFDLDLNSDCEPGNYCLKCGYRDITAPINSKVMCCFPTIPASSARAFHNIIGLEEESKLELVK